MEVFCLADLRPLTFIIFAMVGAPLVLVGIGLFFRMVWKSRASALLDEPRPEPIEPSREDA